MMKPEIKKKWVEALRSGQYAQGSGCLRRTENSYCCLGVLCVVYAKETGHGNWIMDNKHQYRFQTLNGDSDRTHLLLPIIEWAGLLTDKYLLESLIGRNDGRVSHPGYRGLPLPWSFNEIADFIENNL